MTNLYVLTFKESGEVVTQDSIRKYWPSYGRSYYKVAKKVYFTPGMAKAAFGYLPESLKPLVCIAIFQKSEEVVGGEELIEIQKKQKAKREEKKAIKAQEWKIRFAEQEIAKAKETLRKYAQ